VSETINLQRYIHAVSARWKLLVASTLTAILAAAVISFFLLPPVYEASSGLVIIRSRTEITFEPRYRTLSEAELAGTSADSQAHRQALDALAKSSMVAAKVLNRLGPDLSAELRNVKSLMDMVQTELVGDYIRIGVRGSDPIEVADIAAAWGQAYEEYVNELFGDATLTLAEIGSQVEEAQSHYRAAQEVFLAFLGDNQIETLSLEIERAKGTLSDYYASARKLELLIANAKALQHEMQMEEQSSRFPATSHDLAGLLLRTSAFTILHPGWPDQLQLSLDHTGSVWSDEGAPSDLSILVDSMETRRDELQAEIASMSLQEEVLALMQEREREETTKRELSEARDLALDTYRTLQRKEVEIALASQAADTDVRLAVLPTVPDRPILPNKVRNVAIAGALGLLFGVFGALVMEYVAQGAIGAEVAPSDLAGEDRM